MKRYRVAVWHGEIASHGHVFDSKTGRIMGRTSTYRDGTAWRELLEIQCRALNKERAR